MTQKSQARQARERLKVIDPETMDKREFQNLLDQANLVPEQIFNEARQADRERKAQADAMGDSEKPNTCWDDLEGMYNQCAQALSSPGVIGAFQKHKQLIHAIQNKDLLKDLIGVLKNDTLQMKEELDAIHIQHKGKRGGAATPDEMFEAYPIYEFYQLWLAKWNANIMPTTAHILELFTDAEVHLLQQQEQLQAEALAQAQDPTVVTDVEAKDHPTQH